MACEVETIVIGGGAMGSATAWQLARQGRGVTLLEQFEPEHINGASHGAGRNFNTAYSDRTYVAMLAEALPLWRELESETGARVLDQVGIVNHGPNPAFDDVAVALAGADPDVLEAISCTYTTTADEDFVLDRVGPVSLGAGFSGHGFKFTPTVGRILADLVTDASAAPPLFVAGFIAAVLVRTFIHVPEVVLMGADTVQTAMLAMALFGLGSAVRLGTLVRTGWRALIVGLLSWAMIAALAFGAVQLG